MSSESRFGIMGSGLKKLDRKYMLHKTYRFSAGSVTYVQAGRGDNDFEIQPCKPLCTSGLAKNLN